MANKLADFLDTNKIDQRRLMAVSRQIERLRREDRDIVQSRKAAKASDKKPEEGAEVKKPRSGRPVTPLLLSEALAGKKISGAAKTRLVRAVNRVLEQKKKDPIEIRQLF